MNQQVGKAGPVELFRRAVAAFGLIFKAYPGAAAGAIVNAVVAGVQPVAAAWLIKIIIDRIARGEAELGPILLLAAGLGALGLVAVITPYVSSYLGSQLRRRMQVVTSDELCRSVNGWTGLNRFENPESYDQLRLAQQSGEAAPHKLVGATLVVMQSGITFCGFVVTLWTLSPQISLIVVLAALPAIRVQLALSRNRAELQWWNSPRARRVTFYTNLLSGLSAAKEIRLFGLGAHLHRSLIEELGAVNEAERRVDLRVMYSNIGLAVLGALVAAGAITWTIADAAAGRLTLGDLTVFVAALAGTQSSLGSIMQRYAELQEFLLIFGHYLNVARSDAGMPTSSDPVPVPRLRHGIQFRDVWFRYGEALPWALRGLDLFIPAGGSLAIVGLNGAGKSTVVKLLCRFYDPERGQILWDGVDLRDLDPAQLRDRISAVFQDFVCYELTAAENIGLGDLDRREDRAAMVEAADAVGVHDALQALPKGYDTLLSRVYVTRRTAEQAEPGTLLSGGQWQRVALARSCFRADRDLLILDEPSSGLDPEAEHQVNERLRVRRAAHTTLLISHRLGAVRDADHIVVLANGTVVEHGTHDALIAAGTEYARLFALQANRYQAPAMAD
jgi:ATP-binding cassette subfamily B protein